MKELPRVLGGLMEADFADSIVVLLDADRDDCIQLKRNLLKVVESAKARNYKASARTQIRVRIAVTELESWFIGDPQVTRAAYPRVTAKDMSIRKWREPDRVPDTWEWLEKRLIRRKYYVTRMPKVEVARNIGNVLSLDPEHNTSRSFRLFLRTLREVYGLPT